jgi:hypothetical protein
MKRIKILHAVLITLITLFPVQGFSQFFISGGYQGGGHGSGGFTTGIIDVSYETSTPSIKIFPNPFNDQININVNSNETTNITIDIYDLTNRLIMNLVKDSKLPAGDHTNKWDGSDNKGNEVPKGIYYCRLKIDDDILIRKIIKY